MSSRILVTVACGLFLAPAVGCTRSDATTPPADRPSALVVGTGPVNIVGTVSGQSGALSETPIVP